MLEDTDAVDVVVEVRDMSYVVVVHVLDAGVLVEYGDPGSDGLVCHTQTILTVDIIS